MYGIYDVHFNTIDLLLLNKIPLVYYLQCEYFYCSTNLILYATSIHIDIK